MPQEYAASSQYVDARTFGQQIQRVIDDLNRPDLQGVAPEYIRDAIRYWRRKPFFFSDTDNTTVPGQANTGAPPAWQANTQYTQGATISVTGTDGNPYVFVQVNFGAPPANNQLGQPTLKSGAVAPLWTPAAYTLPTQGSFPVYPPATPGTNVDNQCLWANAGSLTNNLGIWTSLSTVPLWNQVIPPIDYIAPQLIEVTAANLRFELIPLTYRELRRYDVIRPAPITVYPIYWAWYQQQIYMWPYPNGFYPLTLSYRSYYLLPYGVNDINYWTTIAERMIRSYARGFINRDYLANERQATADFQEGDREFRALRSQGNSQQALQRIPPGSW